MKTIELIDKYVEETLSESESESREFEILMKDFEFRQDVKLYKEIDDVLSDHETQLFKKQLEKIHNESFAPRRKVKKFFLSAKTFKVAAVISFFLILSAVVFNFFLKPTHVSPDKLFTIYYQPDESIMVVRSGNSNMDDKMVQACKKMESRDYEGALMIFNEILSKDQTNIPVHYYTGISYMETVRFKDAIKPFQFVIDNRKNLYFERAQWYLGLCYLKINDKDSAINKFREISKSGSSYKEKASEILKNIE
jgi:tetratricopeptide (TPR) repeat protein